MKSLTELLVESAALHRHLCPRQVIGARMGLWAGELLGLELPQSDKRLLTIVESDGCFADGVAVATNCWVGRRTLRLEDYGKVAATFVDTKSERAFRLVPHPQARTVARDYAPNARNRWEAMLLGYQQMPTEALLVKQVVQLLTPVAQLISKAGRRVNCDRCGEEIINERETLRAGRPLCRACAGPAYYQLIQLTIDN
jgi:formylmethanofuran dehydrogenase subunit E